MAEKHKYAASNVSFSGVQEINERGPSPHHTNRPRTKKRETIRVRFVAARPRGAPTRFPQRNPRCATRRRPLYLRVGSLESPCGLIGHRSPGKYHRLDLREGRGLVLANTDTIQWLPERFAFLAFPKGAAEQNLLTGAVKLCCRKTAFLETGRRQPLPVAGSHGWVFS